MRMLALLVRRSSQDVRRIVRCGPPFSPCRVRPRSAPRPAEESLEDAFDVVEMLLLDVPANVQAISEYGLTGTPHRAELLAHVRQVFHLRGLARWNARDAARTAEHVAQ